jgi:hypothetical protein
VGTLEDDQLNGLGSNNDRWTVARNEWEEFQLNQGQMVLLIFALSTLVQ